MNTILEHKGAEIFRYIINAAIREKPAEHYDSNICKS